MGGLEDENPQVNLDEEPADTKKWMADTIRDLKVRSDEVSDLERSVSSMQWEMGEVKGALTRVNDSLVKMTEGNEERDRKLDEFIKSLSTGLAEREKRTEERIEKMEKRIDAKMEEKLADLDTRISSIERSALGAGHRGLGAPKVDEVPPQRVVKQYYTASNRKPENRK